MIEYQEFNKILKEIYNLENDDQKIKNYISKIGIENAKYDANNKHISNIKQINDLKLKIKPNIIETFGKLVQIWNGVIEENKISYKLENIKKWKIFHKEVNSGYNHIKIYNYYVKINGYFTIDQDEFFDDGLFDDYLLIKNQTMLANIFCTNKIEYKKLCKRAKDHNLTNSYHELVNTQEVNL